MAQLAFIVLGLALAGAVASWIAGAWFYAQTLSALAAERSHVSLTWRTVIVAMVSWPFALGRLKGTAGAQAAKVNKAIVAFFACMMIAAAATSVATNLARVAR